MKISLSKLEKYWILYDVGNSAFILLVTTIMPIYFNYLAESAGISDVDYLAYWGYAASLATLAVAAIGPFLGTLADTKGLKIKLFALALAIGVLGCAALGFVTSWFVFLFVYLIAKIGYSSSIIFYDSMLSDVVSQKEDKGEERLDEVSSLGFAWGYIGSCIPFVACLFVVLGADKIGITMTQAMMISFFIVAGWWFFLSLPLVFHYKQRNYVEIERGAVKNSFLRLYQTFHNIKKEKHIFVFLIAFFFYIDGVYTIMEMATAYGSALGFDTNGLLIALLVTQIVAFPCSIFFGLLSKKYKTEHLITLCIGAYMGIAIFAIFLTSPWQFWTLAIFVGMFQGGIQALSRSYFAKIIPAEKSGEYFGIMDICGKGASFLGTTLIGMMSQITGSVNGGISILLFIFLAGLLIFRKSVQLKS